MDHKTVQRQIDIFVKRVKNSDIINPEIYLYGSAVTDKKPHDIDIIVKGKFPTKDREAYLYDIYTDIPRHIDFQVYGIDSGIKSIPTFLKDSLSTAIRIG